MPSDAHIAGTAALLGVGLSGGVQTWIAVRKDRRDRRRAIRLLGDEMESYIVTLRWALKRDYPREVSLALLADPVIVVDERDALARELSERHWNAVSSA